MTNYEKNEEFIKQALLQTGQCCFGVRKDNNEVVYCNSIDCYLCKFIGSKSSCMEDRANWLKEEAKPSILEQLMETIDESHQECSDTTCRDCVYLTLNHRCISARTADALISKFNITPKEDK